MRSTTCLSTLWGAVLATLLSTAANAADPASPNPYPQLPEGISSFGATICDGYLYVFGGHVGRIPGNSSDGLSPHFVRINVDEPGSEWESLEMHQSSQSPGLVTWNGAIYRVGGLSFKNKLGEPTVFESLSNFAKYDPATNKWTDLPQLPIPRSSLDAAVVDGKLYVVGGWNLQEAGSQDAEWHDTAVVFDLSKEDGEWKTIATPPFQTRALAAASHAHKLYVLGGMNSNNGVTKATHIYDPAKDEWTTGPDVPAPGQFGGFASSAFGANDSLYYSAMEGIVYRLSDDGTSWENIERLMYPRSFHRLVADGRRVFVTGGVAMSGVTAGAGYLANTEVVHLNRPSKSKIATWTVPFEGEVKQDQALLLNGAILYALGGNRTREPHNFKRESFVAEAFAFNLPAQSVQKLDDMPLPVQGGQASLSGSRIDQRLNVIGGLGFVGDKFQSLDTILSYRLRSKSWMDEVAHMPNSRSMFQVGEHDHKLFLFAGSRVGTEDKGLVKETLRWDSEEDEPFSVVQGGDILTGRRSFGGTVLNGRFYAVGGIGDSGLVETAEAFDFATEKWSEIAPPKTQRVFANLAAAGGKLYLFGGFTREDGHFTSAKTVEVYDPEGNSWSATLEDAAFLKHVNVMLEYQDRLLFYGIDGEQDGLAHFALVDPAADSVSYGEQRQPREERSPQADLVRRLWQSDKNEDGKLTVEEVSERFRPLIERADADKDGFVTREELEAATRESTGPMGGGRGGEAGGEGRGRSTGAGGPAGGGRSADGTRPAGGPMRRGRPDRPAVEPAPAADQPAPAASSSPN